MFASFDCMIYIWKNYLVVWQGLYGDKDGNRSIILEAVASQNLHSWHIYFGLLKSNNYKRYYLLTDGIYPKWACFIQTIHATQDEKCIHYVSSQEAVQKDVEWCFGVLQAHFVIILNPCRQWDIQCIRDVMFTCYILHNMIIEDEEGLGLDLPCNLGTRRVPLQCDPGYEQLAAGTFEVEDRDTHYLLWGDLIEHLWTIKEKNIPWCFISCT